MNTLEQTSSAMVFMGRIDDDPNLVDVLANREAISGLGGRPLTTPPRRA